MPTTDSDSDESQQAPPEPEPNTLAWYRHRARLFGDLTLERLRDYRILRQNKAKEKGKDWLDVLSYAYDGEEKLKYLNWKTRRKAKAKAKAKAAAESDAESSDSLDSESDDELDSESDDD